MSKLKVTTIANVADSESTDVTNVINGSAKAWVNFDGTFGTSPFTVANGGIRAAFNVSSVTDNGTGNYTVNFASAMPDANYSAILTGGNGTANGVDDQCRAFRPTTGGFLTNSYQFAVVNQNETAFSDANIVQVAIFSN